MLCFSTSLSIVLRTSSLRRRGRPPSAHGSTAPARRRSDARARYRCRRRSTFASTGCQRAYTSGGSTSFSSAPSGFFLTPIRKGKAPMPPITPTPTEEPGGFRYSWEARDDLLDVARAPFHVRRQRRVGAEYPHHMVALRHLPQARPRAAAGTRARFAAPARLPRPSARRPACGGVAAAGLRPCRQAQETQGQGRQYALEHRNIPSLVSY